MKLKKICGLFAIGALACSLFTGCGGDSSSNASNVKLGMITNLNASEQKVDAILKQVQEKSNVKIINHTTTFYKNLSTMEMGLESGSIDEMSTYDCVAKYLTAKNPNISIEPNHSATLSDSFCFALRTDEESLKKDINKAIERMKQDGTLDKLVKEYITNATTEAPPAINMPHIDGADTIKVAVTGDLPPLDLVLEDGKPAGFNTALLAEIGRNINKNIEILNIDGDARAAALSSGQADVIFWTILPDDDDRPKDIDTPEGAILSEPYFTDKIVHVKLDK